MSYTSLLEVYKTKCRGVAEYRNAWLSAPLLWDHLARDFLGKPDGMGHGTQDDDSLWKLARDSRVPEHFRIAHAMTFDDILVAHVNIDAAARACCMVGDSLIEDNHWGKIGRNLWEMSQQKPDHRMIGYGLNVTSVNDNWHQGIKGKDPKNLSCAVAYARALLR